MNFDKYRYIVVEGPIGVGKTTLVRRIASHLGARTLLERPEENPFLEKFYRDASHHALPTQLSFLFQRVDLLAQLPQLLPQAQAGMPPSSPQAMQQSLQQSIHQASASQQGGVSADSSISGAGIGGNPDSPLPASIELPLVSDFLLDKDPLFARLTLGDDELNLYRKVYERLDTQVRQPDLVIYLQAQPDTLIERIRKRGVAVESGISAEYMSRLCETYSRFFYDYEAAPLLIVNAEHLNPGESDDDFKLLVNHVDSMRGRREFFSRGE
jgi:deoxyguanosine kinase